MSRLRILPIFLVLFALAPLAHAKDDNDLIKAAGRGDVQRVKALIDASADVNAKDKKGRTALMEAAFSGHADIVTLLLDKGADIQASDRFGDTALTLAADSHKTEVVKLLLNKGANTEAMDSLFGHTALMEAAINGYADIAALLLDHGANMETKGGLMVVGENGMPLMIGTRPTVTALILAAANGKTDIVKLLLDRGANPVTDIDTAAAAALLRTTPAVMLLRDAAARQTSQAKNGTQAPSQPVLASTSRLAGLYQSEQMEASHKGGPKSFYEYIRLYCDGRVLDLALGGEGKRSDITLVARAFDKGFGGSGTYQIQGTAIRFSITSSPGAATNYQGQIEGTALSLDESSQANGHPDHHSFQLVQPEESCPGH